MTEAKAKYIAMAPNYWGAGETLEEAKTNLKKAVRGTNLRPGYPYFIYKCHPKTTVDGMGSFSYPRTLDDSSRPVVVESRQAGKKAVTH